MKDYEDIEYTVFFDDQPGVEPGWVVRMIVWVRGEIISQEDIPLDVTSEDEIEEAVEQAAAHYNIPYHWVTVL
jgi:hypothetical protein